MSVSAVSVAGGYGDKGAMQSVTHHRRNTQLTQLAPGSERRRQSVATWGGMRGESGV